MRRGSNSTAVSQHVDRRRFRAILPGQLYLSADWPIFDRLPRPRLKRPPPLIIEQLTIIFPPPRVVISITPLMEKLEKAIRKLARNSEAMPINPDLGEMIGNGRSSVIRALDRLERAGRIVMERELRARRIVFPDGSATEWGEYRPGHSPYCTNAKGAIPTIKPKERAPESLPLPPRLPTLPPPIPIRFGRVKECEWPMWRDDQRPTGVYCGEAVTPGKSWCARHAHIAKHGEESSICAENTQ